MRGAPKDRISDLPDSILHHILSFLGIYYGARTSVLSKRWNYIWTTVPVLEVWSTELFPEFPDDEPEKFMDFVDGTLHRHSSNVEKFFLHWDSEWNEIRVRSWISKVVRGNVRELALYLCREHAVSIPLALFTCESLISLKLHAHHNIRLPKYVSFPKLKRLELFGFQISNESWNEKLFSNSTVLEELILDQCIYGIKNFCISIATLKLLKIDTSNGHGPDCVFKIDAPKLVTFSYSGCAAKDFVLSSFLALVEADVNFPFLEKDGAPVVRLLGALAHVKCLTVSLQAILNVYDLSSNLLTFHSIKILKISDRLTSDQGLIALLKAAPKLESLIFIKFMYDVMEEDSDEDVENDSDEDDSDDAVGDENEDDDADFIEVDNNHDNEDQGDVVETADCGRVGPRLLKFKVVGTTTSYLCWTTGASKDEPEDNFDNEDDSWLHDNVSTGCLFPHLKSVCFQEFVGNPRQMKWVRLILREAKDLQMMTIRYIDDCFAHFSRSTRFRNARSEEEVMVEIPSFPRASPDCVIKFTKRSSGGTGQVFWDSGD